MIRNTGRQLPNSCKSHTTSAGATAAPIAEPLSKSATAMPRSLAGNHSETALVAPGQFAASPAPNRNRNVQKPVRPLAIEVSMAISEYHATAMPSPRRVPTTSTSRPPMSCTTAYDRRNAIRIEAKSVLLQWYSTFR